MENVLITLIFFDQNFFQLFCQLFAQEKQNLD